MDELQRLRWDTTIVVPSGRLKLYHRIGRHEALREPKEMMEAHGSSDTTKHAWFTLHETIKTQQRDFQDTWDGAEHLAAQGEEVDMYLLMYDCIRKAVDSISRITTHLVAPHVAEAGSTGGSLEDTIRHLTPRSQARIEVESYNSISQDNERLKRELAEAKALIEQKSKEVSVMHTYEPRNSDCLQSISKSMRPIAQTLQQFVRISAEEEGVQVHRKAQELESRVDVLDEALSEMEEKARPIPYHRRKALPKTPTTAAATRTDVTASAAASKAPETTLTLGNLQQTSRQAADQSTFTSRMTVDLARPDPDQLLERQIDQVLGGEPELSGVGRNDSTGSSRSYATPPRGVSDEDYVATLQSVKTKRTQTKGKPPATRQKSPPE
jgi:hypothetical protein